jgi:threonine dehydratase
MIPDEWLDQARERLAGRIVLTPVTYDPELDVYFKWENRQTSGSFKLRGAMNKVLALQPWERERGLVASSAGNHGQGVAIAGRETGSRVVVFTYQHASPLKIERMRALGADVRVVSGGYIDAERTGQAFASREGMTWVSPYNDGQVIAGQATIGLELIEQIAPFTPKSVLVPLGGGGLAAGIGLAMRRMALPVGVIGVQSEASPYFHALFHRGSRDGVVESDSLADGLAGDLEEGSLTIPLVRGLLADVRLVAESQIARAIVYAWQKYQERIEGAGAVGLAAILSGAAPERPAAIIVSGGNIQSELFERILQGGSLVQ